MIILSLRSRKAYARLYSFYNDIDIYVEDSTYVGVYERIINQTLAGRATVTKVIPLGKRSDVEAAAYLDQGIGNRRRLYIVDGDLDQLAFPRQKMATHLYRLRVYSLENLVCELGALMKLCAFALPKHPAASAIAQVDLSTTYDRSAVMLNKYVLALAIAKRHKLRKGVYALNAPSVSKALAGKYICADETKVFSRTRDVLRALIADLGIENFKRSKALIVRNARLKRLLPEDVAPGKEFLLNYVIHKIETCGGNSIGRSAAVSYLCEHCTLSRDPGLRKRLRQLAP